MLFSINIIKKNNIILYINNKKDQIILKYTIEEITHALVKIEEKIINFLILVWKRAPETQIIRLKIRM